ncbi:transposase [Kosakonia quasisacchari]
MRCWWLATFNKAWREELQELKRDSSAFQFHDVEWGIIRLKLLYRGEFLFFQRNEQALICEVSARYATLDKKSLKRWDDGSVIGACEREALAKIIARYYQLCWKDDLRIN